MIAKEKLLVDQDKGQKQQKKAAKNQTSAQVASRLDQVISSPSVKKALDTKSAQAVSRLDTGTYAANTGTQKKLVEQEKNRKSTEAIERLNQPAATNKRGSGFHPGGGFGSEQRLQQNTQRPLGSTILDVANYGAGQFVVPVATAMDVGANMIVDPLMDVIGFVRQKNPEETLLGKGLKGFTDATADFLDWTKRETQGSQARAYADAGDSKLGRAAVDVGAGVVGALPNAALAYLSGGTSVSGQLAAQPVGFSGTVGNAVSNGLKNPLTKVSFIRNFGSGFEEAKAKGASDAEALTAAGLSGLKNALVETSGGIEALPGKAKTGGFRTWAGSALQEGLEEPVQGMVSNAVGKGIYDHARPFASLTDENAVLNPYRAGREFAMGTAVGAIVGGGEMLGNTVMNTGRGFGSYEAGTDGYSNQSSQAITAVQNTNIDVNEPKHVGRATVLKNPYTGKVPIYTMPANRVKPVVTAESVQTAADNIQKAKTAVETTGKSYRNFLTDFLEEVFIRRGGAHDVKVNGLTFDGEAYNVSVHKSAIGKLVSDKNMTAEKLAVLDVLDEVISNGEYMGSNRYIPKGNKQKDTLRFDLFETPVRIQLPTPNGGA